ncbi:hypothetical protein BpHYR1_024786 [Brachionus plicatilis]|uniref:Uncharacterized protein n=1 Tax=Brachionus plicatilis TaxID=10195 RepID=A0A3M7PW14_BRAPC|nr:hypothetical protein BpHYR1_024786 [Brachionus plicatilis]
MSLNNENEQLKCQLKLYQLQNELVKDPYLVKKCSPTSSNPLHLNSLLHGSKIMQQSSTCTSNSTSPSSSSLSGSQSSCHLNTKNPATALIQNILMLQNQQANSNSLAQSFPFLLNQYPSQLIDPITSTPVKYTQSKCTNAAASTTTSASMAVSGPRNEQKTNALNTQTSAQA